MADDSCTFTTASGHQSGSECRYPARFSVRNATIDETGAQRVCGRHIGPAIERTGQPGAMAVTVVPDYYIEEL